MKLIQQLFLPLLLFFININVAQTTTIPDENFEQALIDMNIDSDNTVNGQVLTADIDTVTVLDLSNDPMSFPFIDYTDLDITGISDFTALEILNLKDQPINWDQQEEDILNSNINLQEIYIYKDQIDVGFTINIESLNLSNLKDLEYVDLGNVYIDTIKLDNPNFDYENLTLNLMTSLDIPHNFCIQVSDPNKASNNNPPYNTWTINFDDFFTSYSFSSNCVLSVDDFKYLNSLSIYPNPIQDNLNIENPKQIYIDKVDIFNMTGKKVKSFSSFDNPINVESLEQGIYFIKVMSENRTKTFKVMKK